MTLLGKRVKIIDELELKKLLASEGLLVIEVIEGSVAAKAGIQNGDVLSRLGSKRLHSLNQLKEAASKMKSGKPVPIRIVRNKQPMFVALVP